MFNKLVRKSSGQGGENTGLAHPANVAFKRSGMRCPPGFIGQLDYINVEPVASKTSENAAVEKNEIKSDATGKPFLQRMLAGLRELFGDGK